MRPAPRGAPTGPARAGGGVGGSGERDETGWCRCAVAWVRSVAIGGPRRPAEYPARWRSGVDASRSLWRVARNRPKSFYLRNPLKSIEVRTDVECPCSLVLPRGTTQLYCQLCKQTSMENTFAIGTGVWWHDPRCRNSTGAALASLRLPPAIPKICPRAGWKRNVHTLIVFAYLSHLQPSYVVPEWANGKKDNFN